MEDDTISRQAAIDALHGYFDGMLETDTWSPCDVYGLIEILPSAQSELEDKILAIGYTGKEGHIYIGGRLFAVRELAQ